MFLQPRKISKTDKKTEKKNYFFLHVFTKVGGGGPSFRKKVNVFDAFYECTTCTACVYKRAGWWFSTRPDLPLELSVSVSGAKDTAFPRTPAQPVYCLHFCLHSTPVCGYRQDRYNQSIKPKLEGEDNEITMLSEDERYIFYWNCTQS